MTLKGKVLRSVTVLGALLLVVAGCSRDTGGSDTAEKKTVTSLLIKGNFPPVKRLFPEKRVVVACPPGRYSAALTRTAHAYLKIGHGSIEKSQFPDEVKRESGFILRRPPPGA